MLNMAKTPRTAQALDAYIEAAEISESMLSSFTGVNRAQINLVRRGKLAATPAVLGPIVHRADGGRHARYILDAYANDIFAQVAAKMGGSVQGEIEITLTFPPENH